MGEAKDQKLLKTIIQYINLGIKEDTEEEIKIEIPKLMKGVIQLYSESNSQVIPMLYQMKFGPFIQREINKSEK
jgi:hypothetical protein